ncbi:uncharacterized protein F4812DRAFT_458178 [Daldinia caldariorum]|uniref:uncharacterized protein n=1 Tax=Daldinia caldariorum TaxID=326644 RepID=UPI0020087EEB|nr:uncharacterized protein F4812DRAFT_458178 [Daldinia caldariorum]KAI1468651.1 hypothetical protein F4812DRAFT_458178 [Daldinia caldariorum]
MVALPDGLTLGSPSPARGRSVLASKVFSPGSVVAVFAHGEGAPSIAIPDNLQLSRTCHYCLAIASDEDPAATSPVRVRACTGCRTVYYCSPKCQKADWALAHGRGECKAFRRVRAPDPASSSSGKGEDTSHLVLPTPVRTLVQVLVRPEIQAAMAEVEGHVETVRATDPDVTWAGMELQARAALHYLNRETSQSNLAEAMEILCKLQVNSFNRLDPDLGQSGTYLNPALAMVNHSCIPNAFVQFIGRAAILHAYREIKKGEEIEISYIESTVHRSQRQEALKTRYRFECACPRCKEDLDVYQVCQRYPHLELNLFSLVPDLEKLRRPPVKQHLQSNRPLQKYIEEIYPNCTESLQGMPLPEKSKLLRQRWKLCARLRQAELYAIDPLTQVIVEASVYFCEQANFPYALALSCFLALDIDPYRGPMPFHGQRVKGMLSIAKLLANTASTAPSTAPGGNAGALSARISRALGKMDQATMCQTVLAVVVHYCPAAHSTEWQVYRQASELLRDLESLPGRDAENALIAAFARDPTRAEEAEFFKLLVLDPIRELAGFALEIMDAEFA